METRIYLIAGKTNQHHSKLTNEEFADKAEDEGTVYSLKEFSRAFNIDGFNQENGVIRILNVNGAGELFNI